MEDIQRLVYTSHNNLPTDTVAREGAIGQILAVSRRNNAKAGVTGALMYSGSAFAQVLEGPRLAVEATFERIQRDERHGDVTVLQCDAVPERGFAAWSMALAEPSPSKVDLWRQLAHAVDFDLNKLDADTLCSALRALVTVDEGDERRSTTDFHQVRRELTALPHGSNGYNEVWVPTDVDADLDPAHVSKTKEPLEDVISPAIEVSILREALAEERSRTTALRGEIDALKQKLAVREAETAALRANLQDLTARASLLVGELGSLMTTAHPDAPTSVQARRARA